jgi:tetratricopeptide (TPR) repeat protein
MDMRKRAYLFYMTGRDQTFDGPPPGMILHAYSIRHAIANGFTEYDFLRGNETYKYSFGVKERRIRCVTVGTRNGLNLGGRIDARTVPDVLKEATILHRTRRLVEAECGYRQILEVEPTNADAVHRLGQLLAAKGDHVAAKRLFKTLTVIRPDNYKAWLCLGQSSEALNQYPEAANAYREVIRLKPDLPDAFNSLGRALLKLDRIKEFYAALAVVLDLEARQPARNSRENGNRRAVGLAASPGQALSV